MYIKSSGSYSGKLMDVMMQWMIDLIVLSPRVQVECLCQWLKEKRHQCKLQPVTNTTHTQSASVRRTTGIKCKFIDSACVKVCQEIVWPYLNRLNWLLHRAVLVLVWSVVVGVVRSYMLLLPPAPTCTDAGPVLLTFALWSLYLALVVALTLCLW